MTKKIIMREGRVFALFVLVIIFSYFVSAFGVSSPYWGGNPLKLYPGDVSDVVLELQNMVGDEDVILKGEIDKGNEIARLTDESTDYIVPLGRKDVKVNIRIEVPSGAEAGDIYQVKLLFRQVTNDEGGMLQVAGAIQTSFEVVVIGADEGDIATSPLLEGLIKNNIVIVFVVLVIVMIIAVLIFILIRKRKQATTNFK